MKPTARITRVLLESLMQSLKERIETRIPVQTGNLRDSAVIEINEHDSNATLTYTAPYAAQVEFGDGEHSGYVTKTLTQDVDLIIEGAKRRLE